MPASVNIKEAVRKLIDELPDNASWDDLMYRMYVLQSIDAGLRDAEAGRLVDSDEVRRSLGLPQ